jgi:hypothetical protein
MPKNWIIMPQNSFLNSKLKLKSGKWKVESELFRDFITLKARKMNFSDRETTRPVGLA